jgi:CheY-like chemotaxis protein
MERLIFFVDDDKMILNLLEYTLRSREGYNIRTFISGEECLENLNLEPDLIVLDYIFRTNGKEYMDGLETLTKIREKKPEVPVIVLSSQQDELVQKKFFKLGVSEYIPKNDYFIDVLIDSIEGQFN